MTIVLDTNVLVTAPLKPHSYPAHVLNAILNEKAILLFDKRIIA
jgi:predicted nucleic acid-binding protein